MKGKICLNYKRNPHLYKRCLKDLTVQKDYIADYMSKTHSKLIEIYGMMAELSYYQDNQQEKQVKV